MNQADLGSRAITVSNAGMHHVHFMGSIINPGQSMILGVGSVKAVFRPDDEGQPELRQEMGVVLSADHRIIDGVRGLKFLNIVRELLEQPVRRSEEHTSELQSLMRISYAVFCLKNKTYKHI